MGRIVVSWCIVWIVCGFPALAIGHDSPEHVVEDLTREMAKRGRSPELLYRRACEYRVLGRLAQSADDLRAALKLNPRYLPAQLELSRVCLELGKPDEATKLAQQAERLATATGDRAAVHHLRCEIHLAAGQLDEALAECEQACRLRPGEVEWLLQRSRIQARLARHTERIASLESARRQNPSVVLQIEWIEAQIDAGQFDDVLPRIEAELADSRWQSSWLIRRARVRQQLGQQAAAAADLRAAIVEITERLNPSRPDPSLLVDRSRAYALLGERQAALSDLHAAQTHHADDWSVEQLKALLDVERKSEP